MRGGQSWVPPKRPAEGRCWKRRFVSCIGVHKAHFESGATRHQAPRRMRRGVPGPVIIGSVTDTLSQRGRSERMSLIRGGDTTPEWIVRRIVHSMGFRYRLHVKTLPGKPDLVFPRLRKVIFVHGCFWHRHKKQSCKLARLPKSRLEFWKPKLERNCDKTKTREARNFIDDS
jgi:DNA mismatch endonuclease (patch repair protein)